MHAHVEQFSRPAPVNCGASSHHTQHGNKTPTGSLPSTPERVNASQAARHPLQNMPSDEQLWESGSVTSPRPMPVRAASPLQTEQLLVLLDEIAAQQRRQEVRSQALQDLVTRQSVEALRQHAEIIKLQSICAEQQRVCTP